MLTQEEIKDQREKVLSGISAEVLADSGHRTVEEMRDHDILTVAVSIVKSYVSSK